MSEPNSASNRRSFLLQSAGAAIAGAALAGRAARAEEEAGKPSELRVGLIGCGGRGTGAALQALRADPGVRLVAMADAFEDRLDSSLKSLVRQEEIAGRIDVPAERKFVGFDAYKGVLGADVDVVLLATPPQFRPLHLEAAVEAGKHIFAEKPVAVDAPGVRRALAASAEAAKRGLSLVSGLCLRYSYGFQELVSRIGRGDLGTPHTVYANDYRGGIWLRPRQPDWTDMHWQMRNWYYFTWLSGDFNVEQHVHFLDVAAWALGNRYPVKAIGMGGRQVRTGAEYGNIFDHHSVVYEYADGARLISNTRQIPGCRNEMSASVVGSEGRAEFRERRAGVWLEHGGSRWTYEGEDNDIYQTEHDELFASIRSGKPINNGDYMAQSTLLAIMGRMATYTGREVTWEQAMNSTEDLTPEAYAWGPAPEVKISVPGVTELR